MQTNQEARSIDLGDAVTETRGAALFGQVDITSGYRQPMGIAEHD